MVASRADRFTILRDGGLSGATRSGSRVTSGLVVLELPIALVLVTDAGLTQTLRALSARNVGMDIEARLRR